MRRVRTAVVAGIAAALVAGTAVAAAKDSHWVNVALPDGSVARIEYRGDVAPRVVVAPAPVSVALPADLFDMAPFAAFDRIAAEMDRQTDAMMRQVAAMQAPAAGPDGKVDMAAFGTLPAGTVRYSFVSTSTGNGSCSRSVQMTSLGPDQPPKIVSNSSGDCSAAARSPIPASAARQPAPAPAVTKASLPPHAPAAPVAAPGTI